MGRSTSVIVLVALLRVLSAHADAADPVLTSAQLQKDVAILETAYRELHPGLLRYLSPSQLDAAFADLRAEFKTPHTTSTAYLAFARFAAKIRCGHTYANFFNQPRQIQALFEGTPRVPFYFKWLGGSMVVTRDFTDAHLLPPGTVVERVNGVPAPAILRQLLPLARADGSNDAKRIDQLAVTGDSVYEAFDVYYPLLYPNLTDAFTLTIRRPSGRHEAAVAVRAQSYAERIAPLAASERSRHGGTQPLFEWRDLDHEAVYLKMPTWALFDTQWDWRAWLNTRLDELAERGPSALIVDLRGNEGGQDVGDEILSRLIDRDLILDEGMRLVRYRAVPSALRPYLDTWDRSFENWGDRAAELRLPAPTAPAVRYFSLASGAGSSDDRRVLHAAAPRYRGRVFVLVDASNSSATFQFAQIIQQRGLGTLIGQPTGGNLRGINGGAFFFLRLPNSKIELDLPLIGFFPATAQPDRGLAPDIETRPTLAAIAAGTDQEMAAALGALRTMEINGLNPPSAVPRHGPARAASD